MKISHIELLVQRLALLIEVLHGLEFLTALVYVQLSSYILDFSHGRTELSASLGRCCVLGSKPLDNTLLLLVLECWAFRSLGSYCTEWTVKSVLNTKNWFQWCTYLEIHKKNWTVYVIIVCSTCCQSFLIHELVKQQWFFIDCLLFVSHCVLQLRSKYYY